MHFTCKLLPASAAHTPPAEKEDLHKTLEGVFKFPESPRRFSEEWLLLAQPRCCLRPSIDVSLTLCHGAVRATHEDLFIYHPAADSGADD